MSGPDRCSSKHRRRTVSGPPLSTRVRRRSYRQLLHGADNRTGVSEPADHPAFLPRQAPRKRWCGEASARCGARHRRSAVGTAPPCRPLKRNGRRECIAPTSGRPWGAGLRRAGTRQPSATDGDRATGHHKLSRRGFLARGLLRDGGEHPGCKHHRVPATRTRRFRRHGNVPERRHMPHRGRSRYSRCRDRAVVAGAAHARRATPSSPGRQRTEGPGFRFVCRPPADGRTDPATRTAASG